MYGSKKGVVGYFLKSKDFFNESRSVYVFLERSLFPPTGNNDWLSISNTVNIRNNESLKYLPVF